MVDIEELKSVPQLERTSVDTITGGTPEVDEVILIFL